MRDISQKDLFERLQATQNALANLRTIGSHRRLSWEYDLHSVGPEFIRDITIIKASKAYRRLGAKNQVASASFLPHIRNRLTHVCEVEGHTMRMCAHLGLNHDLGLAIACGHDIGHVPFGHQGEHYLQTKIGNDFTHELMGVIVAQHIERGGCGLNLTHATLDGMYRHSGQNVSETMTQEAWVNRYADKIGYIFADYNDFGRMRWPCSKELVELMDWFGFNQRDRSLRTMMALYEESASEGRVSFEKTEPAKSFDWLRKLMYKEYSRVVEQDVSSRLDPIYRILESSGQIPAWLGISLLTDEEVCRINAEGRMMNWKTLMDTGLGEILTRTKPEVLFSIKPFELDLNW